MGPFFDARPQAASQTPAGAAPRQKHPSEGNDAKHDDRCGRTRQIVRLQPRPPGIDE